MDWLQFISSLVDHLAWPAVVAYLLYLLRGQLAGLAERLEEVTLPGGASAKFKKQLARAAEEVEKIEVEPAGAAEVHAPPAKLQEPLDAYDDQFVALANSFPAAAVIESFKNVERVLVEIGQFFPATAQRRGTDVVVERLLDLNKITENGYELYRSLREARNAAAHTIRHDNISTQEALEYWNKAAVLRRILVRALEKMKAEP